MDRASQQQTLLPDHPDEFSGNSGSVKVQENISKTINKLEFQYSNSEDLNYVPSFNFSSLPKPLRDEWNDICIKLDSVIHSKSDNVVQNCKKCLKAINKAKKEINDYKLRNSSNISQEFRNFMLVSEYSIEINKRLYLSILFTANRLISSNSALNKIKALNNYFEKLDSNLISFIQGKRLRLNTLEFIADTFQIISSPEAVNSVLEYKVLSRDRVEFDFKFSQLKEKSKNIRDFSMYLREIILRSEEFSSFHSHLETDNEKFNSVDSDTDIDYISAEEKAIKRIKNSNSDDERIAIVEDDEEFLPEIEELRKSGWIIKTISQSKQELRSLMQQGV